MIRWALRNGIDTLERHWNLHASCLRDILDRRPGAAWLVSTGAHLLAAGILGGGFEVDAPAAAPVSNEALAVSTSTLTPERIAATAAAVVGLTGAVIGGLALARSAASTGAGSRRRGAIVALMMAPTGVVIGGLVVVTAEGGLGTGNGLGGGVVAMVVGLIGILLGGLALVRSRHAA